MIDLDKLVAAWAAVTVASCALSLLLTARAPVAD